MWDLIQRSLDERQLTLRVPDLGFDDEPLEAGETRRQGLERPSQSQAETGKTEVRCRELVESSQALIDLLNQWNEEDAEEQRETLEFLMKALDEDRPSYRKLFP
jgi:hypothetical protein